MKIDPNVLKEAVIERLNKAYPGRKPNLILSFIAELEGTKLKDKREILAIFEKVTKKSPPGVEEEIKSKMKAAIGRL